MTKQPPQLRRQAVGERTRLDLEAVVPVSVPQPLEQVARERELAGLPLAQHVAVLVQHEPGIVEELARRAAEVDAPPARGRERTAVQPHVERALDDQDVTDGLSQDVLERRPQRSGNLDPPADSQAGV